MKTAMKQLTAGTLLAFLLIVGNVRAEGTEIKASSLETVTETKLEIESWMTDERIWNEKITPRVNEVSEEVLQIENWMTDENTWIKSSVPVKTIETESENSLNLEDWMTSDDIWNR